MVLSPVRWAAAAAWGSVAGAVSYPVQRLLSAWMGEPAYGEVLAQEHVPYTWRLAVTALHAGSVALVVAFGSDDATADRSLRAIPPALLLVVALAAAMVVVP